ncbi:MAG: ferrous iron transport protein A [Mycobacterium sp.]|nr:ferrous iron transport protein A [Mycobacterium sp.]
MSPVSEILSRRTLVSAEAPASLTLADLQPGQRATVSCYDGGIEPCTSRRLFDLGLVPGTEVVMVRRAPLGDPAIFRVGDYEIALRRDQSAGIHVEAAR